MKIYWTETGVNEKLIVKEEEVIQADKMPKVERTVLGGVNASDTHLHIGWAINQLGFRVEILNRFSAETAKMDVENYLLYRGILQEPLTRMSHENAA